MSDTKVENHAAKDEGAETQNEDTTVATEKKDSTPTAKKKGAPKRNWQKVNLVDFYVPPPAGKGEHNVDRSAPFKNDEARNNPPQKGDGRRSHGYDYRDEGGKGKGKGYKGKGYDSVQTKSKGYKGKYLESRASQEHLPSVTPEPSASPHLAAEPLPANFDLSAKTNPKGADAVSKGQQPGQAPQGSKGKKGKDKGKGKDKNGFFDKYPQRKGKGSWDSKDQGHIQNGNGNQESRTYTDANGLQRRSKGPGNNQGSQGREHNQGYYVQPMQPQNQNYEMFYQSVYPGQSTTSMAFPAYYIMPAPTGQQNVMTANVMQPTGPMQQTPALVQGAPVMQQAGPLQQPQLPVQQLPSQVVPVALYQPHVAQLGQPMADPNQTGSLPLMQQILQQVEYYFGEENLNRPDLFLRRQMDAEGFVSIPKLLDFNRMKRFAPDIQVVVTALSNSRVVELDTTRTKVRRRDDWEQWIITDDGSHHSSQQVQPHDLHEYDEQDIVDPNTG